MDLEPLMWIEVEDSDEKGEVHQVLSIDQYLAIHEKTKDDEINDFIAFSSSSNHTHSRSYFSSLDASFSNLNEKFTYKE